MTTAPLVCELCDQGPLEPFDVPGSTMLQYCPHCELYQQGRMVEKDAYEDEYHAGYDKHRPHKVRTARLRLNRIASLLEDRRSARLLEIGCSVGATLEAAVQRGWDAVGVDVSESAVAACRERGFSAEVVGPLDLPFDSHSFDVVCAWHVIEHVQDVRTTLREWSRVLRPGGLLVIETPDANCPKAKRLGPKYRKFWAPEHTYTFSQQSLERFFIEAGLDIETAAAIGDWSGLSGSDRMHAVINRSYHLMRRVAGVEKAFQLFGRRRQVVAPASSRHAA
ncbi:MAG: class I SAM-dependent methyltransferase [Planctomycetales bacterium]|nr:class I SAM-dependent methyltransferase [Planctomycetales bacterium]